MSPLGVKTNISPDEGLASKRLASEWVVSSSISRSRPNHSSAPMPPCLTPLYRQCAAMPRSATSSMRSVRICISTQRPWPSVTVVCSDSYPLDLGIVIQSRIRSGLGV